MSYNSKSINCSNDNSNKEGKDMSSYAASLFIEFCADQGPSLYDEAQESIQVDSALMGDKLAYMSEIKGLSDVVLRGEHKMELLRQFQEHIKQIANNPNDEEHYKIIKFFHVIGHWAKMEWLNTAEQIDRATAINEEKEESIEIFGDSSKDAKLLNYLSNYVDRLSAKGLYAAKGKVFKMRKDAQEGREGLSYSGYVKAMVMVLQQISAKCNADHALLDKFMEMKFSLESVNCSENIRIESVADMSIDMENAIDIKMAAERIAERHNISVYEAFLMLQEQQENK